MLQKPGDTFPNNEHIWTSLSGNNEQRHCGILYRRGDGSIQHLHLAWHHRLTEEPKPKDLRWAGVDLDPVNQLVLAAFAMRLASQKNPVPYAFNSDGVIWDNDTGELLPPPAGHGLTCATFVVSFFKARAIEIVDLTGWIDSEADNEWREVILSYLRRNPDLESHADAIEAAPNAARIRPEEVVAAGIAKPWPVPQGTAKERAERILKELLTA